MKYLIIKFAVLFLFVGLSSIDLVAQDKSDIDNFTVQVDGLGCPFCAYGLEKKFKEFKGIDDVQIEMETGVFTFSYPAHDGLSMVQVEEKVEAAGYTAVDVKVLRSSGLEEQLSGAATSEISDESDMVESELKVSGNCGMCEARIKKAAKGIQGVSEASWDKETQLLSVTFDANATSLEEISAAIVSAGHDTELGQSIAETYDSLPGCCQYER